MYRWIKRKWLNAIFNIMKIHILLKIEGYIELGYLKVT